MKTLLSLSAAILILLAGCSKDNNQDQKQLKTNYYQCWIASGGTVKCTNGSGGNYQVKWTNCNNFVAGKGWSPGDGTLNYSGSASGAQWYGPYGWRSASCLIEFYIGRGGGTSRGSYSTSKGTYTVYTNSCNGPNVRGNGAFCQYNCSGYKGSGCTIYEHNNGWASRGIPNGSGIWVMAAVEGWGGSSGSANVTVN